MDEQESVQLEPVDLGTRILHRPYRDFFLDVFGKNRPLFYIDSRLAHG